MCDLRAVLQLSVLDDLNKPSEDEDDLKYRTPKGDELLCVLVAFPLNQVHHLQKTQHAYHTRCVYEHVQVVFKWILCEEDEERRH